MVAAKDEERRRARELRRQGYSYGEIAEALNVSRSSAHNWASDIEITEEQKAAIQKRREEKVGNKGAQANKRRARERRIAYQNAGREKAKEGDRLHCIGCMLYWAEGAKSNRNSITFANSDPEMIVVFMRFLRESLQVPEDKLRMKVHCYARTDEEQTRIEQYWLDLLDLDHSALNKTQILEGSDKALNRLHNGVCTITVNSTAHLQHIFGAIQEYGRFNDITK